MFGKNTMSRVLATRIADAINHWHEYEQKGVCDELRVYSTESCGAVTVEEVMNLKPMPHQPGDAVVYIYQWGDVTIMVCHRPTGWLTCKSVCW